MSPSLPELLRKNPVFAELPAAALARIARLAIQKQYRAGEALALAGESWPYLLLVAEGSVSALKESGEGRSFVVAELGPGELFWGVAFFLEEGGNPVTLQCSRPAQVYLWSRQRLLPLMLENGKMTWEVCRLMVTRMLHASSVIDSLAFYPVAGRLARLLMEFPGGADSGPIARSLTLDEMAARIGSTREVVCRFLQRFADDGLIKITRTEFEILDREALAGIMQKGKP